MSDQNVETPLRTFAQTALGIAGYVSQLPRGDRAELRRMNDLMIAPPEAFWRIVDRYEIAMPEEDFWIHVIPGMVRHPHNGGLPPGRALAEGGVSPARIERWLRHERPKAWKEAGRLLSPLKEGLNWAQFSSLMRFWSPTDRRRFARDYFLSPAFRKRQQQLSSKEAQ